MSLAEQCQVDPEAGVGRLGAGHRLEQQVDRRAAVEAVELGRDVGQAARLCGDLERFDEAVEGAEDRLGDVDRLRGRVDADHRVAAAEEQAVGGGQQDAAQVVAGVVRLDRGCPAPRAGPSCCGSGSRPAPCSRPGPGPCCSSAWPPPPPPPASSPTGPRPASRRSWRRRGPNRETRRRSGRGRARRCPRSSDSRISRLTSSVSGSISGWSTISPSVNSASTSLAATRSALGLRGDPGELVARLLLVGRGEDRAQVGEGKPLASDHGRQVHGSAPSAAKDVRLSLTGRAAGL